MLDDVPYQRGEALRLRINAFLRDAFALPEADYYSRLDTKVLLGIKAALSDVNNALTLRLTVQFIAWVQRTLKIDESATTEIRSSVLRAKPSSNGFDIHSARPLPFVAEVKCNIPINGGSKYGSAQRAGILKDVKALRDGKSKASRVSADSLRFMVFSDLPEIRTANAHLFGLHPAAVKFLGADEVPSDPRVVYGVYVPLGA
jgi:hypothetical protein